MQGSRGHGQTWLSTRASHPPTRPPVRIHAPIPPTLPPSPPTHPPTSTSSASLSSCRPPVYTSSRPCSKGGGGARISSWKAVGAGDGGGRSPGRCTPSPPCACTLSAHACTRLQLDPLRGGGASSRTRPANKQAQQEGESPGDVARLGSLMWIPPEANHAGGNRSTTPHPPPPVSHHHQNPATQEAEQAQQQEHVPGCSRAWSRWCARPTPPAPPGHRGP